MELVARTLEELGREAARFVSALTLEETGATLVTLAGELGAGKTAFVQEVAKALGVNEAVTSPTFVLEKIYALAGQRWQRLVHIDAYRLNGAEELAPLGFDEIMKDGGTLVMLEWPERVGLTEAAARMSIRANADGSRTLSYSFAHG